MVYCLYEDAHKSIFVRYKMPQKRHILVTAALPYANGPIHWGHLLEHIQADIWVRFQKMQGHECYFVCADDTHGTPVMLAAQKQGISPESFIQSVYEEHKKDFADFLIGHDNYYSTHSPENKTLATLIYQALQKNNKIATRSISQLFDPQYQLFLPDRFVKGTCPRCGAQDQYGDNCEACGTTYSPTDLKEPYSILSSEKPILKTSEHCFFKLSDCKAFLENWMEGFFLKNNGDQIPHLQTESINKLKEWINQGLADWDISRDAPYFGFEIPDKPGQYFYVWLDAPIAYFAAFQNLAAQRNIDEHAWLKSDTGTELYHFIGKDILYFHALFWPSVLFYSGYRTPSSVFAHGFLTLNGQKMSKSRGTFITARTYLERGLNPEWLRYYLAAKLNAHVEDIDFSEEDFAARINSDLIGKFVNIASRTAKLLHLLFQNQLGKTPDNEKLLKTLQGAKEGIATCYEGRNYSKALRTIMSLADSINTYIDEQKPWILAKESATHPKLHTICTVLINAFRILAIYLKPVLPALVADIEVFLNCRTLRWQDIDQILPPQHRIESYQHLMKRIDPTILKTLLSERSL